MGASSQILVYCWASLEVQLHYSRQILFLTSQQLKLRIFQQIARSRLAEPNYRGIFSIWIL